jgi:hypothetical protein
MMDAHGSAAEAYQDDGEDRASGTASHDASSEAKEGVRFADAPSRARLGGAGTIVLRMERLAGSARGRLSEAIDDAMERELAARGATSPGMASSLDPDTSLSDQLFRARQIGVYRVLIALGPLSPLCGRAGALQAEDAATLLFLARATTERPVELVLDPSDEHTGVFVTPVPLKDVLSGRRRERPRATPEPAADLKPTPAPEPEPEPMPALAPAPALALAPIEKHTVGVARSFEDASWRHWMLALQAARGPQPLANFERLFRESYVPLCDAVDHGLSDVRAVHARDEFRASFTRMYSEACPTFAATGKRPKMVFDAPEIAARLGRSQRARTVQLLMVSSMRYDIGMRLKEGLAEKALPAADSVTLWSALPTTTSRQLDCLSRGIEALRSPPTSERDLEAARGRMVDTVRRVKIGSRDLWKLDTCEARIRDAGSRAPSALPEIAESLTRVVAKHIATLAPRTLLFVFGDHGFTFDGGGIAKGGGATPEEVLVPALAFFVREE